MANFDEENDKQNTGNTKEEVMKSFLLNAPPGEFVEVFCAVRTLVKDDAIIKSEAPRMIAEYNKDQFTPCLIEGQEHQTLITEHGNLGSGRFFDPRTNKSFKYEFIKKLVSDVSDHHERQEGEEWRKALEEQVTTYVSNQFGEGGASSTYVKKQDGELLLIVCIESHQYNANNYWNGKWRSQWSAKIRPSEDAAQLVGLMKIQVHYFEDGNVQLMSSKEHETTIPITNEKEVAKAFVSVINRVENEYQVAISENYQSMSSTTFKALRRTLPVTRNKIDWDKITSYKIASELSHANE